MQNKRCPVFPFLMPAYFLSYYDCMKISEQQLDAHIELYKQEYGITLDRVTALSDLTKLLTLVAILIFPEHVYKIIVVPDEGEYNRYATQEGYDTHAKRSRGSLV
jgi:hypothetical protein